MQRNHFGIIVILIPVLLLFEGCTVKYSLTGASISPEIKSASIQYFQNRASIVNPTLSQDLTDALREKIQDQTRLTTVDDFGDVNFEGTITEYGTRPIAITAEERAAQNRLTIGIRVKYTNTVEPDLSFESTFSRYEDYSSDLSLNEVEGEKVELIVEQLVQDIFNEAFVNW